MDERLFRKLLSKILRAIRDKLRRQGKSFEYVLILALGKFRHKIHSVIHAHMLVTCLPDCHPKKSRNPDRLECPFLEKKMDNLHMIAWIEKARSKRAVAAYAAQNLLSVIGKQEFVGVRTYRASEGWF